MLTRLLRVVTGRAGEESREPTSPERDYAWPTEERPDARCDLCDAGIDRDPDQTLCESICDHYEEVHGYF